MFRLTKRPRDARFDVIDPSTCFQADLLPEPGDVLVKTRQDDWQDHTARSRRQGLRLMLIVAVAPDKGEVTLFAQGCQRTITRTSSTIDRWLNEAGTTITRPDR